MSFHEEENETQIHDSFDVDGWQISVVFYQGKFDSIRVKFGWQSAVLSEENFHCDGVIPRKIIFRMEEELVKYL